MVTGVEEAEPPALALPEDAEPDPLDADAVAALPVMAVTAAGALVETAASRTSLAPE